MAHNWLGTLLRENGDFLRPPGLLDRVPTPGDAASYARVTEYYAAGPAYRAERLQRNR